MRLRWACRFCHRTGTTRIETKILFHYCRGKRRRLHGIRTLPTRDENAQSWFLSSFGQALTDAVEANDPQALLRRIDP